MRSRAALAAALVLAACSGTRQRSLAGDWDVYIATGSAPHAGYEGWRRTAFAHFATPDSQSSGFIRMRSGATMFDVRHIRVHGDSVVLLGRIGGSASTITGSWRGDTLVGVPSIG